MFNTSFAQYWKPRTQRNFCLTTGTTGRSIIVASLQATLWSESGTRGDLAAFVSAARRAHCHIANCLSRKSFAHYVLFALSLTKFTVHTMHIAHAILHTLFCTVLQIFQCLYFSLAKFTVHTMHRLCAHYFAPFCAVCDSAVCRGERPLPDIHGHCGPHLPQF